MQGLLNYGFAKGGLMNKHGGQAHYIIVSESILLYALATSKTIIEEVPPQFNFTSAARLILSLSIVTLLLPP